MEQGQEATATITSYLTPLVTSITSAVSPADIVSIIGIVFTAGIMFVLVWFGARKIFRGIMSAVKRGKISV